MARAREAAGGRSNVIVHDIAAGGKSRTWNHLVHDLLNGSEQAVVFLDGDAEIQSGSIDALVADTTQAVRDAVAVVSAADA